VRSEQVRLELPISMSAAPNSFHRVVTSGLGEKIFDQLAIVCFFNAREEPGAEFSDRGCLV